MSCSAAKYSNRIRWALAWQYRISNVDLRVSVYDHDLPILCYIEFCGSIAIFWLVWASRCFRDVFVFFESCHSFRTAAATTTTDFFLSIITHTHTHHTASMTLTRALYEAQYIYHQYQYHLPLKTIVSIVSTHIHAVTGCDKTVIEAAIASRRSCYIAVYSFIHVFV